MVYLKMADNLIKVKYFYTEKKTWELKHQAILGIGVKLIT